MKLTGSLLLSLLAIWLVLIGILVYFKLFVILALFSILIGVCFISSCFAIAHLQKEKTQSECQYYTNGYRHAQTSTIQYLHQVQKIVPKGYSEPDATKAYEIMECIIDGVAKHQSEALEKVDKANEQVNQG